MFKICIVTCTFLDQWERVQDPNPTTEKERIQFSWVIKIQKFQRYESLRGLIKGALIKNSLFCLCRKIRFVWGHKPLTKFSDYRTFSYGPMNDANVQEASCDWVLEKLNKIHNQTCEGCLAPIHWWEPMVDRHYWVFATHQPWEYPLQHLWISTVLTTQEGTVMSAITFLIHYLWLVSWTKRFSHTLRAISNGEILKSIYNLPIWQVLRPNLSCKFLSMFHRLVLVLCQGQCRLLELSSHMDIRITWSSITWFNHMDDLIISRQYCLISHQ